MANTCIWIIGGTMCGAPAERLLCQRHRLIAAADLALHDAIREARRARSAAAPAPVGVEVEDPTPGARP